MKRVHATAERHFALVYQAGIANVFELLARPGDVSARHRLMQGTFLTCETYAAGLMEMGATMHVHFCNKAGDASHHDWDTGKDDAPFKEAMHPRFLAMAS